MSSSESLNSSQWLLSEDLNGPTIATVACLEFFLGLSLNLLVIVHTFSYGKKFINKPSTFLFFILALSNFLMVVLYMPFWIVASAAKEWIFGSTDYVRNILCQINGFVIGYLVIASVHSLAMISVDRFLMIVKPLVHSRYMTWKLSLGIMTALWVLDILVSAGPYYSQTLGEYGWSQSVGACVPLFVDHKFYVMLQAIHALIPLSIITVTSVGTFAFTRGFLRMNLKRQKHILNTTNFAEQKHLYSVQVLNLVGIFGCLILFNLLSWIPVLILGAVGLGIGFQNIANSFYATCVILLLLSNISNPIVQAYFRKDLTDSLKIIFCRWKVLHKASLKVKNSIRIRRGNEKIPGRHAEINNSVELLDVTNLNIMTGSMTWDCESVNPVEDNMS